jgi:hypothetical protein
MFEDSTFESTGRIHTRSRRWMIAVFLGNTSILLAMILIPLIYPEALPQPCCTLPQPCCTFLKPQLKPTVQTAGPTTEMRDGVIYRSLFFQECEAKCSRFTPKMNSYMSPVSEKVVICSCPVLPALVHCSCPLLPGTAARTSSTNLESSRMAGLRGV